MADEARGSYIGGNVNVPRDIAGYLCVERADDVIGCWASCVEMPMDIVPPLADDLHVGAFTEEMTISTLYAHR